MDLTRPSHESTMISTRAEEAAGTKPPAGPATWTTTSSSDPCSLPEEPERELSSHDNHHTKMSDSSPRSTLTDVLPPAPKKTSPSKTWAPLDPQAPLATPASLARSSHHPAAHDHDDDEQQQQQQGPVGCYLVYENASGGRLMLYYSTGPIPAGNPVGFWCPGPGHAIQSFKFQQGGGKQELIKGLAGGDANKRKYYTGWCQFLKLAKAKAGRVIQFTVNGPDQQGIAVDIYAYSVATHQPVFLQSMTQVLTDLSAYEAVAVMPQHHPFLQGVHSIPLTHFLEMGNLAGASTLF